MRGDLVIRLLLVVVAVGAVAAAFALRDQDGWVPTLLVVLAAVLLWVVTRPWHPVVPVLYRVRLRAAWEDWTEALERLYASDDPEATDEALRATGGVLLRVSTMKPPSADRAEHDRRVRGLAAYDEALRAWARARSAGDEGALAEATARLTAARDTLA